MSINIGLKSNGSPMALGSAELVVEADDSTPRANLDHRSSNVEK